MSMDRHQEAKVHFRGLCLVEALGESSHSDPQSKSTCHDGALTDIQLSIMKSKGQYKM